MLRILCCGFLCCGFLLRIFMMRIFMLQIFISHKKSIAFSWSERSTRGSNGKHAKHYTAEATVCDISGPNGDYGYALGCDAAWAENEDNIVTATMQSTDDELKPARNASLVAVQGSASGGNVRYYPT
jgi:hypothetical protein